MHFRNPKQINPIANSAELIDAFRNGFDRVSSVIDGNARYDTLVANKLTPELRKNFTFTSPIKNRRTLALQEWDNNIAAWKKDTYIIPSIDFLFLGRTNNNLREFDFLRKVLGAQNIRFNHINLIDIKKSKRAGTEEHLDRLVTNIRPAMVDYLASRDNLNPELVLQLGQYIVHFIRYTISLLWPESRRPLMAIVANDHSPNTVAFSMAMKAFGVPRLYIQHAEISTYFPPIDFEYNILRNNISLRIYEQIGNISGEVFVISRFGDSPITPRCDKDDSCRQTVVLYTTGAIQPDGLLRVLGALGMNPNISSVHLKPHPSQASYEWPPGLDVLHQFPDFHHVAIVANSSVAIELLHRGIPVVQNFDFDPFTPDYYEFVKSGIVRSVPTDGLSTPFWKQLDFDRAWYDRYTDLYAPTREASEREKARLLARVTSLLANRSRPRTSVSASADASRRIVLSQKPPSRGRAIVKSVAKRSPRFLVNAVKRILRGLGRHGLTSKPSERSSDSSVVQAKSSARNNAKIEWLKDSIVEINTPIAWLSRTLSAGLISAEDAIQAADRLHLQRHPRFFDLLDRVDDIEEHLAVYLWLAFKRHELSGVALPYPIEGMVDAVLEVPNHKTVRSSLEGLAFNACLRQGRLDVLRHLLERGLRLRRDTLPTSRRIALLRHLIETGQTDEYERTRSEFWAAETPLHRLKITDLDHVFGTRHSESRKTDHHRIEQLFVEHAPPAVRSEFQAYVQPVYDRLRPAMRFMDVRCCPEERQAFRKMVLGALREKRPLSMIRLSDGEGYAFVEYRRSISLEDQLNRERHWWGIELAPPQRASIVARVRGAVDQADILGIPSIHRFVRDTHDKSTTLEGNVQGRGLLQVLDYLSHASLSSFGEEKMNLPLFRSRDLVEELLSAADNCLLVSSASVDRMPDWIRRHDHLRHVTVPTHFRTSRNGQYHVSGEPLPLIYESIDAAIRQQTAPGTLVLVASGIIGKIFIGTAKEAGGVALDLGSVMDEWLTAGIHSLH